MIDSGENRGFKSLAGLPGLVVALAWSAALAAAVVAAPSEPAIGAIAIALAIPCLGLAMAVRPAILAIALAFALLAVGRAELPAADPLAATRASAVVGQTVTVTGRVADDSRAVAGGSEVLIEPDYVLIQGRPATGVGNLMVRWRGPTEAGFGDQVRADGKLSLPRDLPTFDRRAYLAQRHVFLELNATSFSVRGAGASLAGIPRWLRARYTAGLNDALLAPHAAVLLGVVLGIRQGIPPDLQNALIATGLIHLMVLSGLKVAVFARIAQGALHPVLGRHAAWPALALICLYALVGGATPAAVRAAAMGCVAIAASRLGRPTHVWTSLALTAAAMLAWHPELVWDVGFQLSFAGTAAIILLTPPIEHRLGWVPSVLREPFAVTCAAQVGTLPMMATDFHVLSPIAPLANAAVLPILPVIVVAGLALGPMAVLPDLARWAVLPLAGLLVYIEQVAYALARVPEAAIAVPRFPPWIGLAYYSSLGPAIAGAYSDGRKRRAALVTSVLAPGVIATIALCMWANAPAQANVLAVGDGQAVLLRSPDGAILIDAGPSPARIKDELGARLPPWKVKLDAIVITAPTRGHIGGFAAALDRPASAVLIPDAQLTGTAWRTAALEAVARGAAIVRVGAGSRLRIAGFTLEVISPEPGAPGDVVGAAYLGLRVVGPSGRSFCDLSDLDIDAQTLAAARLKGPCTYLLLPSGGRTTLSPELDAAARSAQMIASRASGRLARGFPATVQRTDQEGTITVAM